MYAKNYPNLPVACGLSGYFRMINLGLGSPKTDACSFCERVRNQTKAEKKTERKKSLVTDLVVHMKNSFYELLKDQREGLKTICFDHQQNQVLPKVPDQQAYYSRQLYTYNFCVVEINRSGSLNKDNVHIYTWNENDYKKIAHLAPALFHKLCNMNMDGIDTVHLASDACGGQNKNSALIYMASYWLITQAPISVKQIELLFPV